jgi:hypothetical protein
LGPALTHCQIMGGKADATIKTRLVELLKKLNEALKNSKFLTGVRETA